MNENIEKNIQANLVELRKSRKLKQTDLADKIGYSDKTISRWESGSTIPDVVSLSVLADFYGISVDSILHENAITTVSVVSDQKRKEDKINDLITLILTVITIWGVATVTYVALQIIKKISFWQVFIWAVPISCNFVYRFNRRHEKIRWINTIVLSLINWSVVTAIYLMYIKYNLWQLFLLPIPVEAIIVIYTLFAKNNDETFKFHFF